MSGMSAAAGKAMSKLIKGAAVCTAAAAVAFFAALVMLEVIDTSSGVVTDLLGRELHPTMGFMGREMSPGLVWELLDTVAVIVVFGVVLRLWSWGDRLGRRHRDGERTSSSLR